MKVKSIPIGERLGSGVLVIIAGLALAFALAFVAQPAPALADDASPATAVKADDELFLMGNDYIWFGDQLNLKDAAIDNDIIAAGQNIRLDNCNAFGDIRIAGQHISIADTYAIQNITVAGQSVSFSNSRGTAIAAACSDFSFGGSCDSLTVYASNVFINGAIDGDVTVGASNVTIGPDARIKGTLHVDAPQEPVMQNGSEVADVKFTKSEKSSSSVEIGEALTGLAASFAIFFAVIGIIATLLIALLAELLFKRHTAAAAEMIRTRTGATIGTGIVGAIVAPIVVIILCCLVITLPVAGALTLALFAMTLVSGGFAGASLFKLAFPKLGRIPCALAGGAIVGVLGIVPILGSIVGTAAFMYFLGYVLQSIFLNTRKETPAAPTPIAPEPVAPAPAPAPVEPIIQAPSETSIQ